MGYECIMCMETLETPAPAASIAVPQYCLDANEPGPSGRQNANKRLAEDTPEYLASICATTCGHIFHKACLNRWFHQKTKKECPSCRKLLTPGKIFHIYPPCLSEDFISHKRSELSEIEEGSLLRCDCGTEDCSQFYEIYRTLVSDHSKLLQRFADQSDEKLLLVAQKASLEEECARLKEILSPKERVGLNNISQRSSNATRYSFPLYINPVDSLQLPSVSAPSPSSSSDSTATQLNGHSTTPRIDVSTPRQYSTMPLLNINSSQPLYLPTSTISSSGSSRFNAFSSFLKALNWTLKYPATPQTPTEVSETGRAVPSVARSQPNVISSMSSTNLYPTPSSSRNVGSLLASSSTRTPNTNTTATTSAQPASATNSSTSWNSTERLERPSNSIRSLSDSVPSSSSVRNNESQPQEPIPKITIVKRGLKQVAMKSTGKQPRPVQQSRTNDASERFSYTIRAPLNSDYTQGLQNYDTIAPHSFNRVKTNLVAKKSTSKPPVAIATVSAPSASSTVFTTPPTSSTRAYQIASHIPRTAPVAKKSTARKSTSRPPGGSNRGRRPYLSDSSESEDMQENALLKRRTRIIKNTSSESNEELDQRLLKRRTRMRADITSSESDDGQGVKYLGRKRKI